MSRDPIVLFASLACTLAVAGCVPITPYRYTGMTPAPRPIAWDGYPSHAGEVHGEVALSHTAVYEKLSPQIHDTALHVAATTIDGAASITPVRGLDVGLRWSYAAYAWTRPSANGTMPLPSRPDLWGVGPEVRGSFFVDHDKHVALGIAANLMHYQVPWAAYALSGSSTYDLMAQGSDSDWTMSFGFYPSYSFGPDGKYGTAFAMLAAQTSFKNDGFATTASNGSTIQENGFIPMFGGGYGFHTRMFHMGILGFVPLAGNGIDFGPGFMLTVGLDLELWHPHSAAPAPQPQQPAPGYYAPVPVAPAPVD
jgi:hypothetical protein